MNHSSTEASAKAPRILSGQKRRWELQSEVCHRAHNLGIEFQHQSLIMDLDSLPNLDLERLLSFPKFDFVHDITGIIRHMDRSVYPGRLMNCFVPRAMSHQ